tara:strand:+ start:3380 stop:3958 length:579 start_codon:yes stop_codon:yes gene_type:complete
VTEEAPMNIQAILNIPVLETERLILKPLAEEHFAEVMVGLGDKEVRHGMLMPAYDTRERQMKWWDRFMQAHRKGEAAQWAAFQKDRNVYTGLFTVKEIDHNIHRGELGYSILKPFWGGGMASEGVKCVMEYVFKEVNLHTVIAQILPSNYASLRVVSKMGFEQEAHFHEAHFYQGEYYDLLQYYRINPAHKN